jgi:PHD/YefM family antitoxin component YafN of YafNO toxin-antitoxin module
MERVNALQMRQSLGKVLQRLIKTGKPVLVEKDRKPAAVLITLEDYHKRFVDREADEARRQIAASIKNVKVVLPEGVHGALRRVRDEVK